MTSNSWATKYRTTVNNLILILCNSLFFYHAWNHRRLETFDSFACFNHEITTKIRLYVNEISYIKNHQMKSWIIFVSFCDNILLCFSRLIFSFFWCLIELYKVISNRSYMRAAQAMISVRFSFKNCFAFSMRFARVETKMRMTFSAIKMIMMFIFE